MRSFFEEYAKHFALNLGQTVHGLRHLFSHPDFDVEVPRGSLRHFLLSARLRTKRALNDLFFTLIPPHWHHTPEELRSLCRVRFTQWFDYGYRPWRYQETGEPLADVADADSRWDPRCKEPRGSVHVGNT